MARAATRTSTEVVAAVIAAGAGTMVGGPTGTLAGAAAGPVLTRGLDRVVNEIQHRRLQRGAQVYDEAANFADLTRDELAGRLANDERLLELAGRALLVAQDAALQEKRLALSRVLAQALRQPDKARVDRSLLLVSVVGAIDAPHIRFMSVLEPAERRPPEAGDQGTIGMRLEQILEHDPGLADVGRTLLQSLVGLGLVEDTTGGLTFLNSVHTFALTPLGHELLYSLRQPTE